MIIKNHESRIMNHESGVTLLLSILIMSGLALISVVVATFAVQELRSSRAVAVSEPAIAAAETAGEQGLWAIKRNTDLINCVSGQTSLSLGNGALVNSCKSYGMATLNLKAGVPLVFYLYDPANINGNTCNTVNFNPCGGAQYYQNITLTQKSGTNQTTIQIATIDGVAVTSENVLPNSTLVVNIPASVPGSNDLRFKVTLSSIGPATLDVNTNQGMPLYPTVNASGCAAKTSVADCNSTSQELFNRRINITVPQ